MSPVLVTIAGPDRRLDLSVPADTPVDELLPSVIETLGANGGGDWALARPGQGLLRGDLTLSDSGVLDGGLLELRLAGATDAPAPVLDDSPRPSLELPPGSPIERGRNVLPARIGLATRLASAAGAALRGRKGDDARPAQGPVGSEDRAPRPGALTVQESPTPFERARRRWRETDYLRRLDGQIAAPRLQRCVTIAVVSPKGGVGKTTISALIGSLLAHVRRDRTIAVDTNPDFGSLGPALTPDHDVYVDDLLDLLDNPDLTITQLDASLGRGSDGLMVLPAPTDPERMARLDFDSYARVIANLQTKAGTLILDCGTGLQEPPARAAINAADQLVLVTDGEPATATLVAEAARSLRMVGPPIVLCVNKFPRKGARLDIDQLARTVDYASAMTTLGAEPELASRVASGRFTWTDGAGGWQRSIRELAAILAAQWPALGVAAR